jgi:hypothetical protein
MADRRTHPLPWTDERRQRHKEAMARWRASQHVSLKDRLLQKLGRIEDIIAYPNQIREYTNQVISDTRDLINQITQ